MVRAGGYFADPSEDVRRPAALRVLRVLLWADVALTAVMVVAGVLAAGVSVPVVAGLAVMAWPGAVAGVVAWRFAEVRRAHFLGLLAAAAWQLLLAVSELLGGDPRGLTSLLLPLSVAALLATSSVRAHFRHPAPAPYDDTGASLVEYAALVTLAALVLGGLVSLGIPSQLGTGTESAICRVFSGSSCATKPGRTTTSRNAAPNGTTPNDGTPAKGKPATQPCHGFLECTWQRLTTDPYDLARQTPCTGVFTCAAHGFLDVWSAQWNVQKAIVDDGKGIIDLITHPSSLIDAAGYIKNHPGDAIRQLIWDDESSKLWNKGNYLGAASRTVWNVGSWLIPGGALGKTLSKTGKFGKLGKLLDKTGEIGRLARTSRAASKAADKAERLAAKGDYEGARKAAADARRNADEAEKEARKKGCKLAPAAVLALPSDDGSCGDAGEAAKKADEAEKAAERAYRSPERGTPEYERRMNELAKDPAKSGGINAKSKREAEVALDLERRGHLRGPVRRQPLDNSDPAHQVDRGDFMDANGQRWDVKGPTDTFPSGPKAGQKMPKGQRGRYERSALQDQIGEELADNQNVILDTRNLSPEALKDVRDLVASHPAWAGKVIFH